MRINKYDLVMEKVRGYEVKTTVQTSDDVARFVNEKLKMNKLSKEHFVTLALDTHGNVIGVNDTSVGTLDSTPVHPRDVFQFALLSNAYSVIFVHNHPSGDVEPSDLDRSTTGRLKNAGELLGIKVLDHIIVGGGNDNSTSFRAIDLL